MFCAKYNMIMARTVATNTVAILESVFSPSLQVFDVQRKITYKNLANWYKELREYRPEIPCCVVANKIDGASDRPNAYVARASDNKGCKLVFFAVDLKVTQRSFNFGKKQGLPFYFVSAADGTNVVKVCSLFFLFEL